MLLEFCYLLSWGVMISYMLRHYVFSLVAIRHRSENPFCSKEKLVKSPFVSVLVPAHNEEKVIGRLLQRLTELTFQKDKMEVIVINDQSEDATGQISESYASRWPDLIKVVNRDSGGNGKADVLNSGLRLAKGEVICCFDADYVPQTNILEDLLPHFSNSQIGAVQGKIFVLNENESWIAKIAALERIGGYRVSQYARDRLGLIAQYAGTVGLIRRDLLSDLGGFDPQILAEDTDLTFKIWLAGYKVKYVNYAQSGEEGVIGLRQYWHQRSRWATGHMQCAFAHMMPLLRSKRMQVKEKVDGLMLLCVYFLPILVAFSWLFSVFLFVMKPPTVLPFWVALTASVFFLLTGHIAPLLEVIIGVVCDSRKKLLAYTPLLFIMYLINVGVCCIAFLKLIFAKLTGRKVKHWNKTVHNGNCEFSF
jgi:cellulose synthase/poly-beta-1,6-N-acetylglucosamine synthase-like glycosyltransferase